MKNAGKEKRKLNAFDVLVIFLVICLLATFAYRIYEGVSEENNRGSSKYLLRFECKSEYNSILKHLPAGEAVYIASTGELLGYINAGSSGEAALYIITEEVPSESEEASGGETAESNVSEAENRDAYDKVTLSGEIRLSGDASKRHDANLYTVGSMNITAGSEFNVYTKNAEFTLTVVSISAIN